MQRFEIGGEAEQPSRRACRVGRRDQQADRADERLVAARPPGGGDVLDLRARVAEGRGERLED